MSQCAPRSAASYRERSRSTARCSAPSRHERCMVGADVRRGAARDAAAAAHLWHLLKRARRRSTGPSSPRCRSRSASRRRHGQRDRRHADPHRASRRRSGCRSASAPGCISPSSGAAARERRCDFSSDVLNGLPSIVIGIFAWQILVRPFEHFSALAGGIALARDDDSARHAHDGGDDAPRARCRCARRRWRLATRGGDVAQRRAAHGAAGHRHRRAGRHGAHRRRDGAAALHRVRQSVLVDRRSTQPIAALPLQIYHLCNQLPTTTGTAQAWAGALVLLALVLVISLAARFATRSRFGLGGD